jgi:glycosyltransferase involved in cell wall biosynthesis
VETQFLQTLAETQSDNLWEEISSVSRTHRIDISLIVPVRNEAGNLPAVLPLIKKIPGIFEIIIVDGHSHDESIRVARKLLPQARIIFQRGLGKGEAITFGAQTAKGNYVGILDSDGSNDPRELYHYVDLARKGFDLVKGTRYMYGGRSDDETIFRKILIIGAQKVANTLWRSNFRDISYGMFLIKREKLLELDLQSQRHDVEWELMGEAHRRGLNIIEVPSVERKRIYGRSNVKIVYDGFLIARVVLKTFMRRIMHPRSRAAHPGNLLTDFPA